MTAPAVHGPAQLPDLRLWLADQWAEGRPFHRGAAPYHASRADRLHASGQHLARQAHNYALHERTALQHATLWWVAESMVDLLLAAAGGVPDDARFADLPPMPTTGLVVFAKPWVGLDGTQPDHQVTVDALVWGVVSIPDRASGRHPSDEGRRLALAISTYRCLDFAQGMSPDELQLAASTGGMEHGTPVPVPHTEAAQAAAKHLAEQTLGRPFDYAQAARFEDPNHPEHGTFIGQQGRSMALLGSTWVPLGRSDWPVDEPIGAAPWDNQPDRATASMVEDRKVVAAMWHLLHQEGIAQQHVHAPERQAARRTKRAGIEPRLANVQVVTLRKLHRTESAPSDDHAAREWSHRWLVAGHWRWARVGVGRTERRLVYVRPHVKGPEDKPLVVPTRVNAWQR